MDGCLKLGCLAQAMMVAPKDKIEASSNLDAMDGEAEGDVDMEVEVGKCSANPKYRLRVVAVQTCSGRTASW